jgi:hypothetical protein
LLAEFNHRVMHRVHTKQKENDKYRMLAIGWPHCPAYGMMLPGLNAKGKENRQQNRMALLAHGLV